MGKEFDHTEQGRPVLLSRALDRHELRYVVVAGLTASFYLALVAGGLLLEVPYLLAIAGAHAVTICVAFPAYRRLVFRSTRAWTADLWRFLSVWSGGMVAGFLVTPLLVEVVGLTPFVAQVLAILVVAGSSYLAHRFWSFGKHDLDEPLLVGASRPGSGEERP